MRPKPLLVLVFACWSLTAFASPGLADEVKADAVGPAVTMTAPATCNALSMGVPKPLFMACNVQIECADSSVISCSGDSCSTSGTNNRCVTCNGVQQACCPATCCEVCAANYVTCSDNCPGPRGCGCVFAYNNCIAGCTGGCPPAP